MKLVTFTHANMKTKVYVAEYLLFSHYYSPGHQATHLLATGGAIIPVTETVEQVTEILTEARKKPTTKQKGKNNEQSTNKI